MAAQAPVALEVVELSEFDADLIRVGVGLEFWLRGEVDSPEVRAAQMRASEMQRFGRAGRGEVWRRELAEATRKVLVEAGYLPLRRDDDELRGAALVRTIEEMMLCRRLSS